MMMLPTAFLVMIGKQLPVKKHVSKHTPIASPYRVKCNACNDLGRDARLPCEGHVLVS